MLLLARGQRRTRLRFLTDNQTKDEDEWSEEGEIKQGRSVSTWCRVSHSLRCRRNVAKSGLIVERGFQESRESGSQISHQTFGQSF